MNKLNQKVSNQKVSNNLQDIPAGSIGIAQGKDLISKLIGLYWILKVFGRTLKEKGLKESLKLFKLWTSHAFIYFGSGKQEIIEAVATGVVKNTLSPYLNNKYKFVIYSNKNLTVDNLQKGKDWAYTYLLGKKYDYAAFIKFLVHEVNEDPKAYICTEAVVSVCDKMSLPVLPKVKRSEIHPDELQDWLESEEGKWAGWEKTYKWKW